jgi:hypothetical protein
VLDVDEIRNSELIQTGRVVSAVCKVGNSIIGEREPILGTIGQGRSWVFVARGSR